MSQSPAAAEAKPRFVGIDIVKIVAYFLVVSVHFFLYSGFYSTPITAQFGHAEIYIRWICYCCVPLFMITTGYLMKNKTLSKGYYHGALRVLVLYLIISVICVVFNHYYNHRAYTAWEFIRGIFMYTDAQYAWYVEYYFTLFLLIPFVNAAWNGMGSHKNKLIMLITVCLVTSVSQSLYIGFDHDTQIRLIPGYFSRCYPFAYYLIGAYVRDYPPKRTVSNKFYFLAVFVVSLTWLSTSTFQQSLQYSEKNFIFYSWHYNDYGAWPVVLCSAMLFLLMFDITCKNKGVRAVLKTLGNATFAAYLISYCFDQKFYRDLVTRIPQLENHAEMPERCAHWYETVLPTFFCALVCGLILQGLYDLCDKGIRALVHRVKAVSQAEAEAAGLVPAGDPPQKDAPAEEAPAAAEETSETQE